jgi:hypothetical protein
MYLLVSVDSDRDEITIEPAVDLSQNSVALLVELLFGRHPLAQVLPGFTIQKVNVCPGLENDSLSIFQK